MSRVSIELKLRKHYAACFAQIKHSIVIVVLARDILACFGKSSGNNRTFYESIIYRNVQQHGDSRKKKIYNEDNNHHE